MKSNTNPDLESSAGTEAGSKIPPFIIRSGITVITILICGIMAVAWFVPYPESVNVKAENFIKKSDTTWESTLYIPYRYISLIKNDMPVQIEIEGYNAREYGYLKGKVQLIDKKPIKKNGENFFISKITFHNDKVTLYEHLNGQAFILIKNDNLLKRIIIR